MESARTRTPKKNTNISYLPRPNLRHNRRPNGRNERAHKARFEFYMQCDKVALMSIRMRHTRGHTGNRRSHHALVATKIITDKETGNLRLPHHLDEVTGMYRGKQIFTPRVKRTSEKKVKGPSTEPKATEHAHEHAREEHANADAKVSKGISGKVATGGRPKARSGFGGGV